ncbi:hypothetical protein CSKR_200327 [Clonorchis sinensis]|uniref:Secreted protein n=1 Tax=Clonorchis sinensis TaxID=79923 RepID=A0A8T1MDI7_CLOSI|nr:hypothetical protein CSKR_200327 [Clonorchis sinensis]
MSRLRFFIFQAIVLCFFVVADINGNPKNAGWIQVQFPLTRKISIALVYASETSRCIARTGLCNIIRNGKKFAAHSTFQQLFEQTVEKKIRLDNVGHYCC